MTEDRRLQIAARLWSMNKQRAFMVWINADRVYIAPNGYPEDRQLISWEEADRITSPDLPPLTE